jgi:16S rRNA (uracil1498-N3)-methyltransferase
VNVFFQPLLPEGALYLDPDESRHCVKVLRNKAGDSIRITDGQGFFYDAIITKADPAKCLIEIREKIPEQKRSYRIHIAISPTKNADRIEWFVEKTVELGIDEITLIECDNTERAFIKTERLEKVAISAMKQSLKASLPRIHGLQKADQLMRESGASSKFIAYVDPQNPLHLKALAKPGMDYLVLIGPEGDFSPEELTLAGKHGFDKVSLGNSRLRTETAGIAACHILHLIN